MASNTSDSSRPRPPVPPLDWARAVGAVDPVLQAVEKHVALNARRRCRVALGTAAAFAVIAVAGLALRTHTPTSAVATAASFANPGSAVVSQPERQVLADGSVIELRGDAVLTIDLRPELRRVVLARGEAHFQVAKDAARPFVVEAGGVGVRAVGTAFSVQIGTGAVDVLVTEGRVAVTETAATTPAAPALVDAGQRLAVVVEAAAAPTSSPALVAPEPIAVTPTEIAERLAWRVPRLEFNATPLAKVVALFNSHASGAARPHLGLSDSTLAHLPLSGVLRADNLPVLLAILDTSYGLKPIPRADGALVLKR